jgi:hypothetical protein
MKTALEQKTKYYPSVYNLASLEEAKNNLRRGCLFHPTEAPFLTNVFLGEIPKISASGRTSTIVSLGKDQKGKLVKYAYQVGTHSLMLKSATSPTTEEIREYGGLLK